MEADRRRRHVVQVAEDGVPKDDVSHYTATTEHLDSYNRAADELYRFKVPALLDTQDRHSYLLIGLMDGTGNDSAQDPIHKTNVARFDNQVRSLKRSGVNIDVEYLEGPGTQANYFANTYDSARGITSLNRAEEMYARLVNRAQEIYRFDPGAKIAIHVEGFSRGASQVPLLARMIDERGVPDKRTAFEAYEDGQKVQKYARYHQDPGHTPMSVGLYDPVPTGTMELYDRRLPPSVVSGFQINAADERRGLFPVDRIIPQGMSDDGRFLSVSVAGAHSDIGGSYLRNGLGIRSQNLMTDYHNALFSEPLLRRLPETYDARLNVIHRSEEGNLLFRVAPKVDRASAKGEVSTLIPDYSRGAATGDVVHTAAHAPEALGDELSNTAERARPVIRALPTQMTALPVETAMAQLLRDAGDVEVRPYKPPMQLSPGEKVMAAAGVAGIAMSLVDAKDAADRVSTLLSQDNPLAAQSALTHYAARGTGGWVGGAATGLAVGWETGPGVIGFVAVGAVAGSHVGENVAKWWDNKQIYEQKDGRGVEWEFNGRQWLRQEQGDLSDNGIRAPTRQSFSALPEKERELNFLASNSATMLALGNVVAPRDPFNLPANDEDAKSLGDANWKRDAESGDWQRETVIARTDRGHPLTRTRCRAGHQSEHRERTGADRCALRVGLQSLRLAILRRAAERGDRRSGECGSIDCFQRGVLPAWPGWPMADRKRRTGAGQYRPRTQWYARATAARVGSARGAVGGGACLDAAHSRGHGSRQPADGLRGGRRGAQPRSIRRGAGGRPAYSRGAGHRCESDLALRGAK
ncbi:DUF2235 domain-containing protein [Lysobacter sp. Root667]|uniref:phospholipase effector Tle1 domain-containing protein n=1 Tax=Lysobacter sp. Root667 TaxID=1736581 RepID=UPI0009E86AB7|nr:DUF2235 domain-containing protein [Lysobacter sp. Root667]